MKISGTGKRGSTFTFSEILDGMEYSAKDDKFRIRFSGKSRYAMVNMAKIRDVEICESENKSESLNVQPMCSGLESRDATDSGLTATDTA